MNYEQLSKVIWGTAIGDSIGLPMEGLRPRKIAQLGWVTPLKQRFLLGKGMWSDDTEHTLHLIDSAIAANGDPILFTKLFSRRLRFWLSTCPPGIGLATLCSILKQSIGYPLKKAGVFSAGNGPSMRAAAIGALFPNDRNQRQAFTQAHTKLTHSDPKAYHAALYITELCAFFCRGERKGEDILNQAIESSEGEWRERLEKVRESLHHGYSQSRALKLLNISPEKGVSGYSYHTVPVVVFIGMKYGWHFKTVMTEIISLGGDTDSTAAIAGALCAVYPDADIPEEWKTNIAEWPVTRSRINATFAPPDSGRPKTFYKLSMWPLLLMRNMLQFVVIIFHILFRIVVVIKPSRIR